MVGEGHKRGPHGGRRRMRRGALAESALVLLAQRDMHGYELISEIEERTQGRWRPSAGTVYPALA
ncbi:MAG: helix-turn-helix transcriptional regulator, partial [Acidimicrobiales bacterium]|nr:helix-turn-helix transcriptional regulator [Acidimicrobiales bacterium]